MVHQLRVLALGDVDCSELREAFRQVPREADVSLMSSNDAIEDGVYELILIFQSRPSSIDASVVQQLRVAPPAGRTRRRTGYLVRRRDANGHAFAVQ